MKYFCIALLSMLLGACNSEQKTASGPEVQKDTVISYSKEPRVENAVPGFILGSFDRNTTPLRDSVKGNIIHGAVWTDAGGENTVLITETDHSMVNDLQSQHIYAYCYTKDKGVWKQQWQVKDGIDNCEVDATCEIYRKSLTVTDMDKNNIGEVTFLYRRSCKGDVSPHEKKLIMYEGPQKYAIRGTTIMEINGGREGGEKKIDPSFNAAPKPLLDYANQQWDKFGLTKY